MVREFYTSYTATVLSTLSKKKKPLAQPRLMHTRVRGQKVDISEITIHGVLFGPEFPTLRSTAYYDCKFG